MFDPIFAWCKEAVETIEHVLSDCVSSKDSLFWDCLFFDLILKFE